MPLYELEEGGMRKFYRIEREGTRVKLTWGRIGSRGQRKELELASEAAAEAAYEAEKLRRQERGYRKVYDESRPHDPEAARAAATSARLAAAAPLTTAARFMFVDARRRAFVWLEQRGSELWWASGGVGDEAAAVPESRSFGSPAKASRHHSRRIAELLASGYALEAFDAKPPKRGKVAKPRPAPAPALARPTPVDPPPDRPWAGQRWAFFGEFAWWPAYHGATPAEIAARRGALICDQVDDQLDVVVFGERRGEGRSEARKRADKRPHLKVLDEAGYRELVATDLAGKRFAFAGGLDCSPAGLDDGLLARLVEAAGAQVTSDVDGELDYLVVGRRRAAGKQRIVTKVRKRIAAGAPITELDEEAFLDLVRRDRPINPTGALDFAGLLGQLHGHVDGGKLGRALDMLRSDRFQLYARLDAERLVGVVRSQGGAGSVYASWLGVTGHYGCTQPDLSDCKGLQGSACKHLLVLVLGLARAGQLPMAQALQWLKAAHGKRPRRDEELCADTLIQYKGAEAGELDWRPTETIPEDFYAV